MIDGTLNLHRLFYINNRDADDAVYARDGYDYDGYKLRVEFPRGGGGSFRGGRDRGGYRGDRRPGPPARRSQYRVLVTGNVNNTGFEKNLKKGFSGNSNALCAY